jgi:hypothetical protein
MNDARSESAMRVLYADTCVHALNPTNTLMPSLIAATADATNYGPGYSSDEEIGNGIERFVERTGPYDAIVLGPNVPVVARTSEDFLKHARYVQRYTALASSFESNLSFYKDVIGALHRLPVRFRIASLLMLDHYGVVPDQMSRVRDLDLHIIAPNARFSKRLKDLSGWASEERHYQRKKQHLSDAWLDYVSAHSERVLTTVHFVAENEFAFRGLADRPYRVSVPGIAYHMRERARDALMVAGIRPNRSSAVLFRAAGRAGWPVFNSFLLLKLYNLLFLRDLIETKFAFTAPGGFGMPVRKFFEIPAAGALLICMPPNGYEALGFRDGVHYARAEPENLCDVIADMERNPERAQSIARAGFQHVFEHHSLHARVRQLRECFNALCNGTFRGADWIDGQYVVASDQTGAQTKNLENCAG